ncbi:hypothetical protein JCM6882_006021 [Rhodosporidiobolus microsporus]
MASQSDPFLVQVQTSADRPPAQPAFTAAPTSGGPAVPLASGSSIGQLNPTAPVPAGVLHAPLVLDRSPPMTPTPTPSSSFPSAPISAARMRAISPPTPAPSPQPHSRDRRETSTSFSGAGWRPKGAVDSTSPFFDPTNIPPSPLSDSDLIENLRSQINALAPHARQELMAQLIHDSTAADLSTLLPLITPRLKRDFLKTLPLELAFHVLSFMDDARTLARASAVSRFWRALLEDEATWKRMCWKSGFVPPASATASLPSAHSPALESPTTPFTPVGAIGGSSTTTTGERLRTLEFGPRPAEEDDQLYTPAGRERRGTLDRNALSEFAARAAQFDLPPPGSAPPGVGATPAAMGMGLGLGAFDATRAGLASPVSGIAARRGQAQVPPLAVGTGAGRSGAGHGGLDVSDLRQSLAATQAPRMPAVPVPSTSNAQHFTSPPMFAVPHGASPVVTTATPLVASHSLHSHLFSYASPSAAHPGSASAGPSSIPSFPPAPEPRPVRPAQPQPFSYKRHFKTAYLTQDAWLHGPGRLLSTQMSADDGVVTSLGFSDEHIVVGMATSKVHVFEAKMGTYVRTLEGHELGVWCLTLVTKGGGPRGGVAETHDEGAEDDWDGFGKGKGRASGTASSSRPLASPMGTTFSQPGFPSSSNSASTLNVPGSSHINFFRDGATTPLAASFHSSPSSPSHPAQPPRRRRSFPSSASPFAPASPPAASADGPPGADTPGGMGIGAGGPTGDSSQQAGVCGTARGWGQKGAIVVSGGCDRDVRVWEVETGHCLHVLRGHTSTIRCMRVLDGRPIAVSGSRDKTVRVWDIERGVCLHVLNGHHLSVRCLEVSGNKIVSGSYDATCRLWNADTGECLHVFRGHIHQIYAVAFDGVRVVTGSLDSTVRIWSAETGEFLALLQGHTSLVGSVMLDPTANVLVTGGSDGRVIVFSLDTFQAKFALQAHQNSVTSLQVDSRFLVTAGNDGLVKLWDFATGHYIRDLAEPSDAVWRVVFRDDLFVSLSRRNDRTLMDVRSFRPSDDELDAPKAAQRAGLTGLEAVV